MGRTRCLWLWSMLVLLCGAALEARAADAPNPSMAAAVAAARANQPMSDQGTKTCLTCHNQPPVNLILQTSMGRAGDKGTPMGQAGCESCHGPAGGHAKLQKGPDGNPLMPAILYKKPNVPWPVEPSPVEERNAQCLQCHESGLRMNWRGSAMQKAGVACTDCHQTHVTKDPILVKLTQADRCFSCHSQQRAESFEYSHHPTREGKVVCSDCHNPHGSPGADYALKEFTVNQTCYNCHADKRGPMLWEHQPVRDDCLNCHTPHGSNEARLMKERMNFLCASCHSAQSNNSGGQFGGSRSIPFHSVNGTTSLGNSLANPRACLNCHSQIHGSNSPSGAYFFR